MSSHRDDGKGENKSGFGSLVFEVSGFLGFGVLGVGELGVCSLGYLG